MLNEKSYSADAPSKAILLGEHAVVYGQSALAVPISSIRAHAEIASVNPGIRVHALDMARTIELDSLPRDPGDLALYTAVHVALQALGIDPASAAMDIAIHSDIPIASGMGSGAAIATAIIRAIYAWHGQAIEADAVIQPWSMRARRYSTANRAVSITPSLPMKSPILFSRSEGLRPITIALPLSLLVAYTGIPSRTRDAVLDVQHAWQNRRKEYDAYFEAIGTLVLEALTCLRKGDRVNLGQLMLENHHLLQKLDVSCPTLDALVQAAMNAGALGAKMSGGGRGGIMIVLAWPDDVANISQALTQAGAQQVFRTTVAPIGARS